MRVLTDSDDPLAQFWDAHRSHGLVGLRTSGTSTGATRTIVRSTQSWVDSFSGVVRLVGLKPDDTVWIPGPLSSTMNLFAACLASWAGSGVRHSGGSQGCRVLQVTPAALASVIAQRRPTDPEVTAIVAGDGLSVGLRDRARANGIEVVHYYGAAEFSLVTWGSCGDDLELFDQVEAQLRDDVIWIRSPWLSLGYDRSAGPVDGDWRIGADGFASVGDRGCLKGKHLVVEGRAGAITEPLTLWPGHIGAHPEPFDRAPFAPESVGDLEMGLAADLLSQERGISRDRQDEYASRSHQRTIAAQDDGSFVAEIVQLDGVATDERPRRNFTPQRLTRFRPIFRVEGTVTAANSCGINDCAAASLLCDQATHAGLGVPGLRVLATASVGVDPNRPGWGIVPAVRMALSKAGLGIDQIDAIEFNEAFAGQVLACLDELGIDERRNCAQGGALALGHPWGASGAVLVTRLFSQMVRTCVGGRYGLAAIAIGGGQGSAMVVERC